MKMKLQAKGMIPEEKPISGKKIKKSFASEYMKACK